MSMEDRTLNEKESLELITQMIQNTRRNLDAGSGNMFLLWGYMGALTTLSVLAGVYFTKNPAWMWGFWIIPLVGYLMMLFLLRKRKKPVKSYIDKVLVQTWMIFGLVCMMFVLTATGTGRYELILPLCGIMVSIGSLVTGCIIRYASFFLFSALGLLGSIYTLFNALTEGTTYLSLLWFVGIVILSMIIPGHILNHKVRKDAANSR